MKIKDKNKVKDAGKSKPIDMTLYTPHNKLRLAGLNSDTSPVLTKQIAEELRSFFPIIQKESIDWDLLYSIDQHGISMRTLIGRGEEELNTPCILAVKVGQGNVIGAYMSEAPKLRKGYYGNGSCFLWKFNDSTKHLSLYPSSGENEHYLLSEGDGLALGGGDKGFGIWISEDLCRGHTINCATFKNEPLSPDGDFDIIGLELWAIRM
ncbi:TLD-domain-containing protein [Globomyces pollinis-pini]|nr:TLD-domain-containing protein [Globomyces pollinis-pini]